MLFLKIQSIFILHNVTKLHNQGDRQNFSIEQHKLISPSHELLKSQVQCQNRSHVVAVKNSRQIASILLQTRRNLVADLHQQTSDFFQILHLCITRRNLVASLQRYTQDVFQVLPGFQFPQLVSLKFSTWYPKQNSEGGFDDAKYFTNPSSSSKK